MSAIQDFIEAPEWAKQDMFEEAHERMTAAEARIKEDAKKIARLEAALHESNYLLESIPNLPNDGFGWIAGRIESQATRNRILLNRVQP